jgi:8-oxo-dGTP pyrophosphatase MutT (NUDIX family)
MLFDILVHGRFRQEQLVIDYDPERRLIVTPEEQTWMDALWQEKLAEAQRRQSLLFDAPTYRFIDAQLNPAGTILTLKLGPTTYKEYVTTREPAFAQKHTRDELGNTLAVCSVVETTDHVILLDKRQGVDVSNGRYHVIGGVVDRGRDGEEQADPFGAMRRELREETGIQESDIAEQYCLGVVYDLETPHAELVFLTRLNISMAEVYQRTPEDREIQQLHTLAAAPDSICEFISHHHGKLLSTTGEANLLLYAASEHHIRNLPYLK